MRKPFARGALTTARSSSAASSLRTGRKNQHFVYVVKLSERRWQHEYLDDREATPFDLFDMRRKAQHYANLWNYREYYPEDRRAWELLRLDPSYEERVAAIWDGLTDEERAHVKARGKAKP